MNNDLIGNYAGAVWEALSTSGKSTFKEVKKATKLKDKEMYLAIGWLAREGKLAFEDSGDEKDPILALA